MAIDWEAVANEVGGLDPDGNEKIVGTVGGRRALEFLLGEENLRDAVDCFISHRLGMFTAEMVLSIVQSRVAMQRCYEIYRTQPGTQDACAAVFLLGSFAGDEALPWIREFLNDSHPDVRLNGLRVLQNIIYGPLNDEDSDLARELFDKAESDSDQTVRERAMQIRSHLPPHQDDLR